MTNLTKCIALILLVFSGQAFAGSFIYEQIASGFSAPLGLEDPGDGRLFVLEQAGRVQIIDTDGTVLPTPFLNITSLTNGGGEQGLLGLAFHPLYQSNGLFFVNYTNLNGDTVIARFQTSGDPDIADFGSRVTILSVDQDFTNHNGGGLDFGPDGYLYIGLGDGGSGGDPCNRAQTVDPVDLLGTGSCAPDGAFSGNDDARALLGKMLRIDVDISGVNTDNVCAEGVNYSIPADNPFEGAADARCSEIWAYGLRNPFRFSFDRLTGDLFIGDVGQNRWEEVDLEPFMSSGGLNYGWNDCEGFHVYPQQKPPVDCPVSPANELPILEYPHSGSPSGCSIAGGYRYRGPDPSLTGIYIFGDYCSGEIFVATEAMGNWSFVVGSFLTATGGGPPTDNITSFGEDSLGRVYRVGENGGIYRLGRAEMIFDDGFEN